MATRSTIAIETKTGTVLQVYCHWDGYLDNNGKILHEHYNTREKVEELIRMGNLSSLKPTIDECVFYKRDRKENGQYAEAFESIEDYFDTFQYEEFNYIFRADDNWYFTMDDGEQESLAEAMETV